MSKFAWYLFFVNSSGKATKQVWCVVLSWSPCSFTFLSLGGAAPLIVTVTYRCVVHVWVHSAPLTGGVNMAGVYRYPVYFECHSQLREQEKKIEKYFHIRRKSGGGECGPLTHEADNIYSISFKCQKGKTRYNLQSQKS